MSAAGQGTIVVCDSERSYCLHLLEYLHSAMPGRRIDAFTDPERMLAGTAAPESVELLIVAENALTPAVMGAGYPQMLVLSETGAIYDRIPCISKYQSMEVVMENIRTLSGSASPSVLSIRHGAPMRTIGFYTPVTRCLQTLLAMTAGELLSEKDRTLYMNFEGYSGLSHLLGRAFRGSMGELVYYNECDMKKVASHLSAIVERVGGMDLVPPCQSPGDLAAIHALQWVSLFGTLDMVSEYAFLVLDVGSCVGDVEEILRACDIIYTIERGDSVSVGRLMDYEKTLVRVHGEDIRAKTRRIELPRFSVLPREYDQLTRGPLGTFARELLSGDGLL